MAVPFATRWEVVSSPWHLGSFVEGARVRPLTTVEPGEWWVERLHPNLKPEHRARVLRRWYLASKLTASAWPLVLDAGDDGDRPWVVTEAMGHRPDGTFPFADPSLALREVRSVALALAEAEAVLARRLVRPALALRPNLLTRTLTGRLMLHLAALDQEPDMGFPTSPGLFAFTPEELLGHPTTARSTAFLLGWLLCLTLTGRAPYDVNMGPVDGTSTPESEAGLREVLRPLILAGKLRPLGLPEALHGAEVLIRRSLVPNPGARFPSAAAFAEALSQLAPPVPERSLAGPRWPVTIAEPVSEVRDECLPAALEARLVQQPEDRRGWLDLARQLEEASPGGSARATLVRAQALLESDCGPRERANAEAQVATGLRTPGLAPVMAGEQLELSWRFGYVRTLAVRPTSDREGDSEARVSALVGLLQHPSLRFVQELSLLGNEAHARAWVLALQRQPLAALRRVSVAGVAATDPWAADLAYRYPRWTWTWGNPDRSAVARVSGLFKKLLGLDEGPSSPSDGGAG